MSDANPESENEEPTFLAEDLLAAEILKPLDERDPDLIENLNDALTIQNRPDLRTSSKIPNAGLIPKAVVDSQGRYLFLRPVIPRK